ncbi:TonB-dependent receptor [Phenylobacterium sp.]|uniref:TonB-dependent receptor n=1 Tax=Phenylobacterium sp. TaxID=1871053 RepID=UPI002FC7C3AC
MFKFASRRALLRTSALVCSLVVGLASTGASAQVRAQAFDIPAQSLANALRDYGRAADQQLIFTEDLVRGRRSGGLKATLDRDVALDRLLVGTDLTWKRAPSGGIMILRRAADRPQDVAAAGNAGVEVIDEIIVVGSRLARAKDGPAPVTIIERDAIDRLGSSNVADVLNYLPQQSFSLNEAFNVSGERRVQLRGLGAGTTLVLINGRRTVVGASAVSRSAFDLNTIPLAAVERVEVLADSASAVYGADAVGGVVNIVLKTSLDRPVLEGSYGAAQGGGEETRVSFSTGGRTDRARGAITVDYFKRDPLYGATRDYIANADYRRFGGVDRRVLTANPGNICAVSGNLPGLSTPCAAVPAGSTGVGLTPANFTATAGQQNLDSLARFRSIVPESRRYSATASGSYDLTAGTTLFAEFMYSDRYDDMTNVRRSVSRGLVPAANPFNPFGVPVLASYLLTGLPSNKSFSHETAYRETVGLKGRVWSWDWELALLGAQSDADYETRGNIDAARVTAALAAANPALALNVFQDGPGGSFALLNSLLADPSANASSKTSDAWQVGGFARGDLFQLPAGAAQAVVGAEWRRESISYQSQSLVLASDGAKREASSAYAELRLPILDAEAATLGDIAVTVAGRYDHYSDFGGTFNAQYGVEWRPVPNLLVRASYGESFRAPGLFELYTPRTISRNFFVTTRDPRRGGELISGDLFGGGNPDLDAETSTSASVGLVWTPDLPGRPRVSASYWRIEQDQRVVTGFSADTVLANEANLPGRVVRAAPSAADLAAGRPGRVLTVDNSLLNLGSLKTSGLDMAASARFDLPFGEVSPSVAATWVETYQAADFVTSPVIQRVGVANLAGSIPEWKIVGSLGWRRGGLEVTATVRHISGYDDAASNGVRNGLKVDPYTLVDLQAGFDVEDLWADAGGLTRGVKLRVGATNLFDQAPSFSDLTQVGYDPSQADLRQRFVYASVSKAF